MTNALFQIPRPVIFAHRGASACAPENTICAFELAIAQGADAIELDAKLSADQKVIIFHDATLRRITGINGKICDFPLYDLKKLDAGSFFSPKFRGEQIPTLDEVFESIGKKTFINIELTNYNSPHDTLPELVVQLVCKHHLENRVLFSSFLHLNIIKVKKILPEAAVALLALPGVRGCLARSWIGRSAYSSIIHPNLSDITPHLINKVKRHAWRAHAWTVNHPDDLRRLFNLGLDGIFTDNPYEARQTFLSLISSSVPTKSTWK